MNRDVHMNWRLSWRHVCDVGALALVLILAMAGSAVADSYCPTGYACFWTETGYNGDKKTIPASQGGAGWINLTGMFDNNIESGKNRFTNRTIFLAAGYNGTGGWIGWAPGADCDGFNNDADRDCNGMGNNQISSFYVSN